ncbi:HAD family hydrolase [Tranquillimonas rosea]|uniref:HAD family hydrolase n=1 Tax=Tranquillimonas rosea TaxID=641238 RepID=UPI003BA93F1B
MIEAILFDKDGTLFDFQATWGTWAGDLLFELSDGEPHRQEAMAQAIGYDLERLRFYPDSPAVTGTPETIAACLHPFSELGLPELVAWMNDRAAVAPQVPAAALAPLMAGLAGRGLRLGVVTNDAVAPTRAHLATAGIEAAFELVIGSDSGYGAKPAPGQIAAFCTRTGIAPGRVVMVGDAVHDMKAAQAAGACPVAVLTGTTPESALAPLARVVLPSVASVPDWLDRIADTP